jgi:hypothetical protein
MKRALVVLMFFCIGCTLTYGAPEKPMDFSPRYLEKGKYVKMSPSKDDGYYFQGHCSPFAPANDRNKQTGKPSLDTTACLVHGLGADHAKTAIESGIITSAYHREGPKGKYGRIEDKMWGGGLAVYTRAVGVKHSDWPCSGYGVGSGDAKVQFVLSPNFLIASYTEWRASGSDNKGRIPGYPMVKKKTDDCWNMWGAQTENSRNENFLNTVNSQKIIESNEQLIWERVELQDALRAIVCHNEDGFKEVMKAKDAKTNKDNKTGTVKIGNNTIKVIFADPKTEPLLLDVLKKNGIANANNQVR